MAFVRRAAGADQCRIGIAEQAHRIRVQWNMWPVFLAVTGDALKKFLADFGRLDADAEDLNFTFEIAFPLVNKGRHLGPAPRSPTAAVKEHDRCRRVRENGGKLDRRTVDVLQRSGGE